MIKIILVDDHQIVRKSLYNLIKNDDTVMVVGDVANGAEALDLLNSGLEADIILTDIAMPVMDGLELIERLKASHAKIKVILLTMLADEKFAARAFIAGATGFLSKNIDVDELFFCLKHVNNGNRYLSSELCISILEQGGLQFEDRKHQNLDRLVFSEREKRVLALIAEGKTNQEIADELFLSRRTVESQRQSLIDKTGMRNSASLVKYAVLNGYID